MVFGFSENIENLIVSWYTR